MAVDLIRKLEESLIDVAILLSAPSIPGITVEELYQETFVLVANPNTYYEPLLYDEAFDKNYVGVNWGKEFQENKNHFFPTPITPQLSVNIGLYEIRFMLERGGCGYFPFSMISEYIKTEELMIVNDALKIKQPVYLAYSKEDHREFLKPLLGGFKSIAKGL